MANELQVLTEVHHRLASITTVEEAKDLRDKAEALRCYFQASKQGLHVQNRAAYIKTLCERRAGELLLQVEREPKGHGKTAPGKKSNARSKLDSALEAAGIAPTTAKRWQYLARYPESELARIVAQCNHDGEELTTALMVTVVQGYLESIEGDEPQDSPQHKPNKQRRGDNRTRHQKPTAVFGTAEQLYRLREIYIEARSICKEIPEFAGMTQTLGRWIKKIQNREEARNE